MHGYLALKSIPAAKSMAVPFLFGIQHNSVREWIRFTCRNRRNVIFVSIHDGDDFHGRLLE